MKNFGMRAYFEIRTTLWRTPSRRVLFFATQIRTGKRNSTTLALTNQEIPSLLRKIELYCSIFQITSFSLFRSAI